MLGFFIAYWLRMIRIIIITNIFSFENDSHYQKINCHKLWHFILMIVGGGEFKW